MISLSAASTDAMVSSEWRRRFAVCSDGSGKTATSSLIAQPPSTSQFF
jgi:hypothetical protein